MSSLSARNWGNDVVDTASSERNSKTTVMAIIVAALASLVAATLFSNLELDLKLIFLIVWTGLFAVFIASLLDFHNQARNWRKKTVRRRRWLNEAPSILDLMDSAVRAERIIMTKGNQGAFALVMGSIIKFHAETQTTSSQPGGTAKLRPSQFPGSDEAIAAYQRCIEVLEARMARMRVNPKAYATPMEEDLREMVSDMISLHNDFSRWQAVMLSSLISAGARCPDGSEPRILFDEFRNKYLTSVDKLQNLANEFNNVARKTNSVQVTVSVERKQQDDVLPR